MFGDSVIKKSDGTRKQLRCHVDGSSDNAAGHHGLWFTEAQVCDFGPVLLVQLRCERKEGMKDNSQNKKQKLQSATAHGQALTRQHHTNRAPPLNGT